MKKNLYNYYTILVIISLFTSCKKNEFEIISIENKLIKNKEISNLKITQHLINTKYDLDYAYYENGYYITDYNNVDSIKNNIKKNLFKEKLKGIQSLISIKNNSDQIIEQSNITVLIKFTFENDKIYNYVKKYLLLPKNKVWEKNKTLDIILNDVISFTSKDEIKVLDIHKPVNVTIEYYIAAKNSINYNNLDKNKKNSNIANKDEFDISTYDKFGFFTSNPLKEKLGYGEKILSDDITGLWNENIKTESLNKTIVKPKNGDLDKTFESQESLKKQKEENFIKEKKKLISEGWKDEEVQNGELSSCYNFKSTKGKIENRLEVIVGVGTDVSIKMMNLETEKCIRYVFINNGTTYSIENIPEGKYYLKIAYGKDWLSKVENEQCIGKFIKNPLYEKGEDILDFNIQHESNGKSIPSYQLSLDVISSGVSNSFNSKNISESDFNK